VISPWWNFPTFLFSWWLRELCWSRIEYVDKRIASCWRKSWGISMYPLVIKVALLITEIQWRRIKKSSQFREMKNFKFPMFNCKTKLIKKESDDVLATKKWSVWFFIGFLLWNKKTIIYKREKWDKKAWDKIFCFFFQKYKI